MCIWRTRIQNDLNTKVKQLTTIFLITILSIVLVQYIVPVAGQQSITVHVLHARTEPVYQKLPNGKVVEVYADVYYPDILLYHYTGNETFLGKVNVTVHCNWTGGWGADVKLIVIDPGFKIDPTTFKPTTYGSHWAEGGCLIGPGSAIVGVEPIKGKTGNCTNILLWPRLRFYEEAKKNPGAVIPVKLFIGVRLALYNEKGEIVEGGIINVYTDDKTAPNLTLVLAPAILNTKAISRPPDPATYGATAAMVVLLGYVLYTLFIRFRPKAR